MRLLLIHNLPPDLHPNVIHPLARALELKGVVEVLEAEQVTTWISGVGEQVLRRRDGSVVTADAVLTRIVGQQHLKTVASVLEHSGVPVINPVEAEYWAGDKHHTATRLARSGLTVPEQIYLTTPDTVPRDLTELLGVPFVLKPPRGSKGSGVCLVETVEEAQRQLQAVAHPLLAQRFVREVEQGDLRLLVVRGEVVAAMRRIPAGGDFRANLNAGAKAHPHTPTLEEVEVALAATMECGLTVAGVDLIPTEHGPVVLEVNPIPGMQVSEITGVDVAGAIAAAVAAAARKNSHQATNPKAERSAVISRWVGLIPEPGRGSVAPNHTPS